MAFSYSHLLTNSVPHTHFLHLVQIAVDEVSRLAWNPWVFMLTNHFEYVTFDAYVYVKSSIERQRESPHEWSNFIDLYQEGRRGDMSKL